jgi:hypothetical protein
MKSLFSLVSVVTFMVCAQSVGSPSSAYAMGSKLAVTLGCPDGPASDPDFTFTLRNSGPSIVYVETQPPISVMINLTVRNAQGVAVEPEFYNSGMRSMPARGLEPGKSLVLDDFVRHDVARTSIIPLHVFGYNLQPGTYTVSAKATDDPHEPASNTCDVVVK